jgi:cytochrome c oxidase cbb3-type subunit I/II
MEMEKFQYDNQIVRMFFWATVIWGITAFTVGLTIALQLPAPIFNFGTPWLTFGRLRPLHTNAAIFAFVGNGIFTGYYYAAQRLLKARNFSDMLGRIHFWGWQLIILAAALTLPAGLTTAKEYAELEWPIDIAIALIWVAWGVNMVGTIIKRREKHLYVAMWFFISTFVTVAMLHIVNSLEIPVSLGKSYSLYAGVQDALAQLLVPLEVPCQDLVELGERQLLGVVDQVLDGQEAVHEVGQADEGVLDPVVARAPATALT